MTIVDTNNVLSIKNIDILSKKGIDLNVVGRGDLQLNFLVTGGAGFIGKSLVLKLSEIKILK